MNYLKNVAAINKILDQFTGVLTRRIIGYTIRQTLNRRKQLTDMFVLGNTRFPKAGILWGSLIDRISDKRVLAELGIPDNIRLRSVITKALKESLEIHFLDESAKHLSIGFSINYRKLRQLTPHPGADTLTGSRIKVKSWLDWLTGDSVVTGHGFITLKDLGRNPSRRPKSPRAQNRVGDEAGWMIDPDAPIPKKRSGATNRGLSTGRKSSRRGKPNVSNRWRISNPLPRNFLTEQSNLIGYMMLDFYGHKLVQTAANQALRSLRNSAIGAT